MGPLAQELATYAAIAIALGFVVYWLGRRRTRSCAGCDSAAQNVPDRRRLPVIR